MGWSLAIPPDPPGPSAPAWPAAFSDHSLAASLKSTVGPSPTGGQEIGSREWGLSLQAQPSEYGTPTTVELYTFVSGQVTLLPP